MLALTLDRTFVNLIKKKNELESFFRCFFNDIRSDFV